MPTFPSVAASVLLADRAAELGELHRLLSDPAQDRFAVITGPGGIGKTALARHFAKASARTLHWMNIADSPTPDLAEFFLALEPRREDLIVADGLDVSDQAAASFLNQLLRARGDTMTIVTARSLPLRFHSMERQITRIELGPLPDSAIEEIWRSNRVGLDYGSTETSELLARIGGHPLVATLLGHLIRDEIVDAGLARRNLRSFSAPGLVGPNGQPIDSERLQRIEADIQVVGAEVLTRLETQPQLLYELTPRQFEELVAELLQAMGYETEITPATRDGGKDIYAARNDALGRFLYIVECKKYAPDNPVGVGVVRSLAGVVNAERANGGIVATTSFFTRDAQEFQKQLAYQLTLQDYFGIQEMVRSAQRVRGGAFPR